MRSGMHRRFALEYIHHLVAWPTRDFKKTINMAKKSRNMPILIGIEELAAKVAISDILETKKSFKPETKKMATEGTISVMNHGIANNALYKYTQNQ